MLTSRCIFSDEIENYIRSHICKNQKYYDLITQQLVI